MTATTRGIITGILTVALVIASPFVVPNGLRSAKLLLEQNDPEKITAYRLKRLSADDYQRAIGDALADDDSDLASSILFLADSRGVAIPGPLRERTEIAVSQDQSISGQLSDLIKGATTGQPESTAGLIGAVASDLTTVGDVRDIIIEGGAYVNGESYDPLILGLSVAGLVITGAVVLSGGSAGTAKLGTSALKAAGKAGAIATPLRRSLVRLSGKAVNTRALSEALPLIRRGNITGARRALATSLDTKPLAKMQDAAMEVGTVMRKQGFRAGTDMLKVAETPAELSRLGKLSTRFGKRFRAILFMLGSGAVTLTGLLLSAAGWTTSFAIWLAGAAYVSFRFCRLGWRFMLRPLGRMLFPRAG